MSEPFEPAHQELAQGVAASEGQGMRRLSGQVSGHDAVAWMFYMSHGHVTQFKNFQECAPPEIAVRSAWVELQGASSGSRVARLPLLPHNARWHLNTMWHARRGLDRLPTGSAVFFTGDFQVDTLALLRGYRKYFYTDLTMSLLRQMSPWYDDLTEGGAFRRFKDWGERLTLQQFEGVFAMSRWAADGIARDFGVNPRRIHVALPGANLRRWEFVDRSDHRGPVRILMVGGEFARKGGHLLLDWAERTSARGWELDIACWPSGLPPWVLASLGNPGPFDHASGSLGTRLPHVRVHCNLKANEPNLMALFRQADIFCLPTHADGSSIASLEAMASGLPVIVGAVGGIPELINDGTTGVLLRPSNAENLAAALDALIADRPHRLRLGRAGREACESFYNVERQVREIVSVMDNDAIRP